MRCLHHSTMRWWLALCFMCLSFGYNTGDPLQMSKRIQVSGKVTAWHDVPLTHAPEFGETKAWIVPGLVNNLQEQGSVIKLSFSFGHDRLVTPWITLSKDANVIRFKFTHAGGDLVDLQTEHMSDDAARETLASSWALEEKGAIQDVESEDGSESSNDYLTLLYEWDEVSAMDVNMGLNALFLSAFLFTLFSAAAVVVSLPADLEKGPPSKSRKAR
eukprot:TRINITY_DN7622_c0_g1_i7.p1 TRINITY_DN7622_c0_g1~~TRINITY_DN7622_c0_g1_i7.p1  ORF type:complete len:216 (-),score=33.52 TRINITY_DN7622_c0_g1_i7:286-933(-)